MSNVKVRINKYDNMRGIAILLIVLWHLDVLGSVNSFLFKFAYMASLPVFFFVSGYFSKIGPDEPLKSFRRLLIPYIIFTIIKNIFGFYMTGSPIIPHNMFISKTSILWFLIALFIMKMMLPIVDRFRYPLLTTIILALVVGFINIEFGILGILMGIGFFPLFIFGFYYKDYKNKLETQYGKYVELFKKYHILITILAILFIVAMAYFIPDSRHYLFKKCYKGSMIGDMVRRMVVLTGEFLTVLLLNRYMPNKECVLTKMGLNSMAVYVLHYFIVLSINPTLESLFAGHKLRFLPVVLILTFIITYVLSRDFVTKYLNKFTDIFYRLIVKTDKA